MIGKIVKIIHKSKFGFIKSTTNEEFHFKLDDFINITNIDSLNIGDKVKFMTAPISNGKNKSAIAIFKENNEKAKVSKQKTVQDILNDYPINLDSIIKIAKKLNIDKIWNESSYISDYNIKKITNKFFEENVKKANLNNPTFKQSSQKSVKKYTTTNNSNIMEKIIKDNYLVFVDTSSLMNYNMLKVLNNEVIPYLKKYKKKLYIVDSVIYEIKKKIKSFNKESDIKKAKSARYILDILSKKDLYVIPETNSITKDFADAELITCFTNYRTKYNLCLITNDNKHQDNGKLAGAIMKLNKDPNIRTIKDIKVLCINKSRENPKLIEFSFDKDSNFNLHDNVPKRVIL